LRNLAVSKQISKNGVVSYVFYMVLFGVCGLRNDFSLNVKPDRKQEPNYLPLG
jgi:hypothetical protein